MPSYVITGPDGKKYRVSGQGSPEEALAAVKRQAGASVAPAAPQKSGSILPISTTPDGGWQFDSNAGIVGAIKRSVMLPKQVMTGEVPSYGPDGRTSDELIGRSAEMAATVTPINPAMRAGSGVAGAAVTPRRPTSVTPPTPAQLLEAGGRQFDQARELGVGYRGDFVKYASGELAQNLYGRGFDAGNAPETFAVLTNRLSPEGSEIGIRDILAARAALKGARQNFNKPKDKAAAEEAVRFIDKLLEAANPKTLVAGTSPEDALTAGSLAKDANANYAAGKRSELLNKLETDATRRADAANSGLNMDNTIRARTASILEKDKLRKGFNQEELDAMEGVTRGTFLRNRTRGIGNKLAGGGGVAASVLGGGIGTAVGMAVDPTLGLIAGIGVPSTGYALRKAANSMTLKALKKVDEQTRRRSPLYEQMLRDAPNVEESPEKLAAIARALLLMQQNREDRR